MNNFYTKIFFTILLGLVNLISYAQCNVTAIANIYETLCGDTVILSALGEGITVFEEDFNDNNIDEWVNTPSGSFQTNICNSTTPDNSIYYWFGGSANSPRFLESPALNLSTGGTISFQFRFSNREGGADCEDPDAPDEGVSLQYSTNNGATWIEIQYWDPSPGSNVRTDPLRDWTPMAVAIPNGAKSNNTKLRWVQLNNTGDALTGWVDHWGIENIKVEVNPPDVIYVWEHTGIEKSDGLTPPVVPTDATTTYKVNYTFGDCSASADVTINVNKPKPTASASTAGPVCPGTQIDLDGTIEVAEPIPTNCDVTDILGCRDNFQNIRGNIGGPLSNDGNNQERISGTQARSGRMQLIYTAAELQALGLSAGRLTEIGLYILSFDDFSDSYVKYVDQFAIHIGCTNTNTLSGFVGGMTEVYNNKTRRQLNTGLNMFQLDRAFVWDGKSNIIMQVCFKNNDADGGGFAFLDMILEANNTSPNNRFAASNTNGSIDELCEVDFAIRAGSHRPIINFGFCPPYTPEVEWLWTPDTEVFNPDEKTKSVSTTISSTTTYTVSAKLKGAPDECYASDNVTVSTSALGDFNPTFNPVCEGSDLQLNANISGMTTYSWSGPNGFTSNDENPTITNVDQSHAGTYSIYVDNGVCSNTKTVEVTIDQEPFPGLPNSEILCMTNDPIDLFDYLDGEDSGGSWTDNDGSGGLNGSTLNPANISTPGDYTFTYEIDINSCGLFSSTVPVSIKYQGTSGEATDILICNSQESLNLFDQLEGFDNDGTWSDDDNTNKLNASTLNSKDLPAGIYEFSYTVESEAPCVNTTSTVQVEVSNQPNAFNDTIVELCSDSIYDLFLFLNSNVAQEGIWDDLANSQALDRNNGLLNTGSIENFNNSFYYILEAEEPCITDTAIINASITPTLELENLVLTCTADGLDYIISFDILGGDTNTYEVDIPGEINYNTTPISFTSDPVPNREEITFSLSDAKACNIITETVVKSCACVTETDAMDSEELIVCSDETAIATSLGGYVSDGNDTLVYYLHEGSGIQLVSVVDSSHTPEFSFNPATMSYGTTYYISAGAGDNDGNDFVDRADLCFILSQGTPVKFKPLPEVALDLADQVICTGDSTFLVFNVDEGTAPFVYTISTGETTFDVNSNSVSDNFKVKPSSSTSYAIIRMEDAFCENNPNQSVDLELTTPVRATIIPTSDNCFGANPNFDVELSGAGTEFSITYTNNFNNQEVTLNNLPAGISNVSANFAFSDKVTEYYLTFAEDNSNTVCEPILTDTFRVFPEPSAQLLGGDGTYCPSDIISIPVSLTGIGPWNITISDGASYNFSFNNIQQNDTTLTISSLLPGDYTFSVSSLEDLAGGCFGNGSGQVNVTVNPGPIANISIQNPVDGSFNDTVTLCEASTAIDLIIEKQSGNGDLIGELFVDNNFVQNVTIAGTETINIPSLNVGNTRIELRNVQDNSSAGCGGISNPVVAIVNPTPSADINLNGPSTICAGDPVNFFYNVYGNGDISFDIVNQFDERDSFTALEANNFHGGSVNTTNTGTLNYRIENIVDNNNPQCSGTSSSTLSIDVLPVPTADITAVSPTTICLGESVEFEFNLTGDGVVYAVFKDLGNLYTDTVSGTQGTVNGFISNLPVGNHTVEIVEVFNQAGARCDGSFTGSVNITVNDVPDASASYSPLDATCLGDSVNLNLTVTNATFPITVHYSEDATSNTFIDNLSSPSSAILRIAGDLSKSVSIDSIVDVNGCTGYPNVDEPLTVHALPEGQLNGTDLICAGEDGQIEVILSGNGPFNVSFEDNLGNSYNENLNQGSNILTYNVSNDVQFSNLIIVNDNNTPQCSNNGSGIAEIEIRPTPIAAFDATEKLACPPMETIILNQSTAPTGYNFKQCLWEFSDGRSFETCNDTLLTFETVGTYGAKLTIINEFDCVNELEVPSFITVNPNPVANFSYAPEDITLINNVVNFRNNSAYTYSQNWVIDSSNVYTEFEPSVIFNQASGTQISVCLEAIGNPGFCRDTTCQLLNIEPIEQFYIPNSFTPDDDGINDVFKVIATHYLPGTFEMRIFNQWGEEIFFSNDINVGWDGTYNLDDAKMGIYAVRVSAESAINPGQLLIENATINLMR